MCAAYLADCHLVLQALHPPLDLLQTALRLVQPCPGGFSLSPQVSQLLAAGLLLPAHQTHICLLVQSCLNLLPQGLVDLVSMLDSLLPHSPCTLLKQLQAEWQYL